jgi:galactokinase/mevalonate kinase-like predicted kinase
LFNMGTMHLPFSKIYNQLTKRQEQNSLPSVIAYQRVDGPGSSLDLREFQQALWYLPKIPKNFQEDPALTWSQTLPRTVAISIDTGTKITAYPLESNMIGVESLDFGYKLFSEPGEVLPTRENWLLKILDAFNISGVKFVLQNLRHNIKSSGLGGSATAAIGVCILANELAGKPFSNIQLISMASRMEQDLGVSLVGTQEQSNVLFGGVTDYIWFPWGIPNQPQTGYGESLRTELIPAKDYSELESRMAIFHTGKTRQSADVNSAWRKALSTSEGFALHKKKPQIAYDFREAIRLRKWKQAIESIRKYREIRTSLCAQYMDGAEEMSRIAQSTNCEIFPLGAGGGGAVLIFAENPGSLVSLRQNFRGKFEEIQFKIKAKGHELINPLSSS